MSLKEQVNADLKEAMRSQDALNRTVLRGILTAFKEAEQGKREDLVKQAIKQRGITRPAPSDAEAVAAYEAALAQAIAEEDIEQKSSLEESEALRVVQKLVKMRQDSIAEAEKAGRSDVAEGEQAELAILEKYLPAQLSREDIEREARAVITEVNASDPKDMGKVMGVLNKKLQGQADGKLISEVVRQLLAN